MFFLCIILIVATLSFETQAMEFIVQQSPLRHSHEDRFNELQKKYKGKFIEVYKMQKSYAYAPELEACEISKTPTHEQIGEVAMAQQQDEVEQTNIESFVLGALFILYSLMK